MPLYRIRKGDTLAKIARKHGMKSWRKLYNYDGGTGVSNRVLLNKQKKAQGRHTSVDNPNIIHPRDLIFVPSTGQGVVGRARKIKVRTLTKPFKDVFAGVVRLGPQFVVPHDVKRPPVWWWHKHFHLRIVEATKKTKLSKLTEYFYESILPDDPHLIYLLTKEHAHSLKKCAVVVTCAVGNATEGRRLPDYYKKGNIPKKYKISTKEIYVGQRFFLLRPIQVTVHDDFKPTVITAKKPSYLNTIWLGLGEYSSGDGLVLGVYSVVGKVYNMGDAVSKGDADKVRNALLLIEGAKVGPGLGGTIMQPCVIFAHGYRKAHMMKGKMDWSFDFDVTLYSSLSGWLKGLRGMGKIVDTWVKYKKLQNFAENTFKNIKSQAWKKGIYTWSIPSPLPHGAHLWLGIKTSQKCTVQDVGLGVP